MSKALVMLVLLCACLAPVVLSKLEAGAGCDNAKEHCDAPKSNMGCCGGNTKCYSAEDCASYLKTCPFSNDTKKGESLGSCGTDKSPFKEGACAPGLEAKIASTDGKAIPLKATVKCFQSEKLTCEIYRNATGHSFITAACKESAKKASGVAHSVLSCCVLLGLLVVGLLAVMGFPL